MYQQFFPSLILSIISTDRNTTLSCLHTVGIQIMFVCQFHQFTIMLQALFHQRNSFFKVFDVFTPLIIQYQLGCFHFQVERIRKFTITMHIILQTGKFVLIWRYGGGRLINSCYCLIPVLYYLSNNIQRHFTYMRLFFPFFLHIFYQLLPFRSATFIESRIDGIFIWIDKLAHKHTQQ